MKRILFFLLLIVSLAEAWGQQYGNKNGLFTDSYYIDPDDEGLLSLSIDNLSFFKNNEYDGDIIKGYSLPGFKLQPRVIFHPASFAKLEAGVSLLRFWGADKYPATAYENIGQWRPDDYQYGFHILPFFRAQIQASEQVSVVLGSIYGAGNHRLAEPLYNPELNLTADQECGAQFLYNSRVADFDLWVNWESFIFKDDDHNEAFTMGASTRLNITDPESFFHLNIPVQGLLIHRGGEIDTIDSDLLTAANAMAGLNFTFNVEEDFLRKVSLDVMCAGYEEFKGNFYPFERGWALYSKLQVDIWNMGFKLGYWRSSDYVNLYGNPFYSNTSLALSDRVFTKHDVFNAGISYEQEFGNGFYLGANAELFYMPDLTAVNETGLVKESKSFNHSMGLYLRINPSIVLKKFFLKNN